MEVSLALIVICFFTAIIHFTETLAYSMRLAGLRVKKIAIAMAFVTSTLLISRLSNMFQAPLLGAMVDTAILKGNPDSLLALESSFRVIIMAAFFGALLGALLTPTAVQLFQKAIEYFQRTGSIPQVFLYAIKPKNIIKMTKLAKLPSLNMLSTIQLKTLPKQFLIINIAVTSIYVIGVLCSLLAGAYLPEFRATAIQLSGIVNGMATILFTIFVDPPGARVTDQAMNQERDQHDVRSVVFFLQCGKLLGILVFAQLLLKPFTYYIMWVTTLIKLWFV